MVEEQKSDRTEVHIEPFEMTIWNSDYANAYTLQYDLTDEKLAITFRGEIQGQKDSLV